MCLGVTLGTSGPHGPLSRGWELISTFGGTQLAQCWTLTPETLQRGWATWAGHGGLLTLPHHEHRGTHSGETAVCEGVKCVCKATWRTL